MRHLMKQSIMLDPMVLEANHTLGSSIPSKFTAIGQQLRILKELWYYYLST